MKKVLLLTMALVIASCSKQDDNTTEILNISQEKVLSDDEIFELFDFDTKGTTVSTSKHAHGHDNWIDWLSTDAGRIVVSEVEGDVWSLTSGGETVAINSRTRVNWDGSKLIYGNGHEVAVSESAKAVYDRVFGYNQTLPNGYVKNRSPEYILELINDASDNGDYEFAGAFDADGGRVIGYSSSVCHDVNIQLQTNFEGYVSIIHWQDPLRNGTLSYNNGFAIEQLINNIEFTCLTEPQAVILPILREIDPGFFLASPTTPYDRLVYNDRNGVAIFKTINCDDLIVVIHNYSGEDAWQAVVSTGNVGGNYNSGDIANILTQFSCYTND